MRDYDIISSAVDALTGKQIYSFTIKNKNPQTVRRTIFDWLMRKPMAQPTLERKFDIYPSVVANQYRIAAKALSLPKDLFDDATLMLAYVPDHLPTMVYIIASAIQNTFEEPEADLIQYLERNADNIDIAQALGASLQATNMQSFSISIVLMNGMATFLKPKASPHDGSELIASHKQI